MKATFRYKFSKWNYITLIVMFAAIIPFAIINMLKLFEVGRYTSIYKGLDITSIIISLLLLIFVAVMLVISRYTITKDTFVMQTIVRLKIAMVDVLMLRKDVKSGILVMYFIDKRRPADDAVNFMVISIKDSEKMNFVDCIRSFNPKVIFELFDKNLKNP